MKKKLGWTAVYRSCPDVDGRVYQTRNALIEAHGPSVFGLFSCGKCGMKLKKDNAIAKIARKPFPAKGVKRAK